MSLALLFPGQGAEQPGMGVDWRQHRLINYVSDALDRDVPRLLRRGGPALARTDILQPVLVSVALAAVDHLRARGVTWTLTAGRSLGEWSAWCAAGGIRDEDVIDAVIHRSRAMAEAAKASPGGMVLGKGGPGLTLAIDGVTGPVWVGDDAAVRKAVSKGARRVTVSGPWHSGAMASARQQAAAHIPVSLPLTHTLVLAERGQAERAELVRDALLDQLEHPARWRDVVHTVANSGVTGVVAIGPSRHLRHDLRGLGLPVYRLDTERDLQHLYDATRTVEPE